MKQKILVIILIPLTYYLGYYHGTRFKNYPDNDSITISKKEVSKMMSIQILRQMDEELQTQDQSEQLSDNNMIINPSKQSDVNYTFNPEGKIVLNQKDKIITKNDKN